MRKTAFLTVFFCLGLLGTGDTASKKKTSKPKKTADSASSRGNWIAAMGEALLNAPPENAQQTTAVTGVRGFNEDSRSAAPAQVNADTPIPMEDFAIKDKDLEAFANEGKLPWLGRLTPPEKDVRDPSDLSDADAKKVGRLMANQLVNRYTMAGTDAQLRYVNMVGQVVARQSSRPNVIYRFGVLNTDEVNAYALPEGFILLTRGMMQVIKNESELAGVLAHEINHISQRHLLRSWRHSERIQGKPIDATLALAGLTVLDKGYSKEDESEADRAGILLAMLAGYNTTGIRDVVVRAARRKTGTLYQRFFQNHPSADLRQSEIKKVFEKEKLNDSGPHLAERYTLYFPAQ